MCLYSLPMKDEAILKRQEKYIIKEVSCGNEEYLYVCKVKSGYA
jgi:hypothetical protein